MMPKPNSQYVPFKSCSTDFLLEAEVSSAEKEQIAHGNAERLLHLAP
jgi:predicted TIM-barrel fold metal-dependent hydrolase